MNAPTPEGRDWNLDMRNRTRRVERAAPLASNDVVARENLVALLEAVIEPGDRVCIEGALVHN